MPANQLGKIRRAHEIPADAVIFDLEDSVPAGEPKRKARHNILLALKEEWPVPVYVRVNSDSAELRADLDVLDPANLCVPKASIAALNGLPAGSARIAIVEDAVGLLQASQIALHDDIEVLLVGMGDMSACFGIPEKRDGVLLGYARAQVVVAARAAGCIAIDGGSANYRDQDAFRIACRSARECGFDGILCTHPMHVDIANQELRSPIDDVAWAHRVIVTVEEAKRNGLGVGLLDGGIVDDAHVRQARRILERQ